MHCAYEAAWLSQSSRFNVNTVITECMLLLHPAARIQLPHINLAALVGKWIWRALHLYSLLIYAYTRVLHDSLWMALLPSADITKILMGCAWDCFKVVKEIKAQKRIWTWVAVHCYRSSVGSIRAWIMDLLQTGLWWVHHETSTPPPTTSNR